MAYSRSFLAASVVALALVATPVHADPAKCQKTIIGSLKKFKKVYLKAHLKCLDAENVGKIPGPCPDAKANLRIGAINTKVVEKIAATCLASDLTALGYPTNCDFEPGAQGKEGDCAALPVTNASQLAECLKCWKEAELSEYMAILYASHAVELCGTLDESSATCSDLDCTTPLPDQRNLGDTGENDCQRSIGKSGVKYLLAREKVLEKCGLAGGTATTCLDSGDPLGAKVLLALQKAEQKKEAGIRNKCGNRDPIASPPFCCRTGTGNVCTAATTREECTADPPGGLGGTVQEDKQCVAGSCDPAAGNKKITWWENCPESATCPGTALTVLDDLIACVDTAANEIVAELLCIQFPTGWPCPADSDSGGTTTTATTATSTTETSTSTTETATTTTETTTTTVP
jgi:hypothetical protein